MAHHKHHGFRRHHNPFAAGSVNTLAIKVAGAVGGMLAAGTLPSMVSPSLGSGWPGVGLALVVAFGGAYLLKGMSQNLAEGVLIGGSVNAASRAVTLLTGKSLALGQYAPLSFTIPTPAYSQQAAPAIAASASKTSGSKTALPAAAMSGRTRQYSKWVS